MSAITFDEWWENETTPEMKQDLEAYYNLTKEEVLKLATEANLAEKMSDKIDLHIKSRPFDKLGSNKLYLEFLFSWVDRTTNSKLFEKSLGVFETNWDKTK